MHKISTFKDTLNMKLKELEKIRDEFLVSFPLPKILKDFNELIELKNKLYRYIYSDSFKNLKFPVTNVELKNQDWYQTELMYYYARQGLAPSNPLKVIYGIEKETGNKVSGFFTTCCQSANWSVLYTIWKGYSIKMFDKPHEAFFETAMILRFFNLDKNITISNVVHVDSSFEFYEFPSSLSDEQICFVDTTCIHKGNKELNEFIIKGLDNGWKVILTRSHLKLDSLGAEYGQLGSITILNEDRFPIPNNDPNFNFIEEQTFKLSLWKVISTHSYFAKIDMIYPFMSSSLINSLISKKEQRLINNYETILKELTKHKIEIVNHKNNIFISFETQYLSSELSDFMVKKNRYITSIREKIGLPIYYSDSFGFDFCTVTAYSVKNKNGVNKIQCRLSIGDLYEADLNDSVKLFPSIINKLRNH